MTKSIIPYFICLLTLAIPCSCRKAEDRILKVNLSVPQNPDIVEPTPYALATLREQIDEILEICRVNNDGFIFLARAGEKYVCGKLGRQGYAVEYLNWLDYRATDLYVDSSNSGESWRFYVSGDHPVRKCGAVYEYLTFTGQSADIGYFPSLESVNAMQYDYEDYVMTCVGTSGVYGNTVYQFSEQLDYIVLTDSFKLPGFAARTIYGLEKAGGSKEYLAACDSSGHSVLIKFNSATRSIRSYEVTNWMFPNSPHKLALRQSGYGDSTIFVAVSMVVPESAPFPAVPTSSSLDLHYLGSRPYYFPPHSFVIDQMQINNCRIKDVVQVGDVVYACGVMNYYEFPDNNNVVGNAMLLRFQNGQAKAMTFGNHQYLSEFNSMSVFDGCLFLGGYTGKYFLSNANSWFLNQSASKPYFLKIPLTKLI